MPNEALGLEKYRSVRRSGFFVMAALCLNAISAAYALDILSKSGTQPVAPVPAAQTEPILDFINKFNALKASSVPVQQQPESRETWTVPREEPAPRPAVAGHPKPGDPEQVRWSADDDGPIVPAPVAATKRSAQAISEPEKARQWQDDEAAEENAEIAKHVAASGSAKARRSTTADAPRFSSVSVTDIAEISVLPPKSAVATATQITLKKATESARFASGAGLDSDAAETAATIALQPLSAPEKPAAPIAPPEQVIKNVNSFPSPGRRTAPPVEAPAVAKAPEAPSAPAKPLGAPSTAAAVASTGAKTPVEAAKKPDPVADAERDFNDVIMKLEKEKPRVSRILGAANDRTVPMPDKNEVMHVRDPRAAQAMKALLQNTPLAMLSGKIVDGTTKRSIPVRVRITDMSNSVVGAAHPEGFFCRGGFAVNVISGPVKVEADHGRFYSSMVQRIDVKAGVQNVWDVNVGQPSALNFAAQGWHLADLNFGLRTQPGERGVWLGDARPELPDLILAAQTQNVRILGVPLPWGNARTPQEIEALAAASKDVLLIPLFPGPRHAFHGTAMGLGLRAWHDLPAEVGLPEVPLRESFEEIRARGGLAVYTQLNGSRDTDLRTLYSLFPRLEKSDYFSKPAAGSSVRLYAGSEMPFDTVTGPAYDVMTFNGSPSSEKLWFNLLNQGYPISVIGESGGSLEGGKMPFGQTFIYCDGAPTREKVLAAIRKGNTAISYGPAAFCRIIERDTGPGSVLQADGRKLTMQIQAYSSMTQGAQIDRIEIIRNGELIHGQTASQGESEIPGLCWTFSETSTAWYVVRVVEKRNMNNTSVPGGTAWTSPIYFRGPAYSAPTQAISRISGTLRSGLNPIAGTVTAVVPGAAPRQVPTDKTGRYRIEIPACGTLIFEAPGCEPTALRVFEHPKVQKAMGSLQKLSEADLLAQLSKPSLLQSWKLLLSELEWNIDLTSEMTPLKPELFKKEERIQGGRGSVR